jgi:hypothetical protein
VTTAGPAFVFGDTVFPGDTLPVRITEIRFFVPGNRMPPTGLRLPLDRRKPACSRRANHTSTLFFRDRPNQRDTIRPKPSPAKIKATHQDSGSAKTAAIKHTGAKACQRLTYSLPHFITASIHSIRFNSGIGYQESMPK